MSLGNRIIFVENVKAKPSSHRSRAPGFLRIAPIDSGQQITELGRGDRHRAVDRARPQEAAPFQPLREQAGSLAVMPDHLQQVASATTKAKQLSAQRIAPQYLLHLQRQACKALPHVSVASRQPYPHAARNRNHGSVSSPRMIRSSVSTSTSQSTITRRPFAHHNLDSTTARSGALLRLLRHDHCRHESGNVAKPPVAIRLAPGEQELVGNPMPTRRRRCQPRSRKTLLDYPQLFRRRPSTAATRVNNFKATDVASVSKVIHTDNQLHAGQFGKAAYTGWIRFIEDGRVCLTNNAAERALRGFALGRKW